MSFPSSDVAIVGGGLIGLAIARALASNGATVCVVDRTWNAPLLLSAGQASAAAAGMLAPLAEFGTNEQMTSLGVQGLLEYPEYLDRLAVESRQKCCISDAPTLRVAFTEDDETELRKSFDSQRGLPIPTKWLSQSEVREAEPSISPDVRAGILSSAERPLNPRCLHAALKSACSRLGVQFLKASDGVGFETKAQRIAAVTTAEGRTRCNTAVVSAGAWSASVGKELGLEIPVEPVRGQILSVLPQTQCKLRHTVYTHAGYLVPRSIDGFDTIERVIVGATEEHVGFRVENTAGATSRLLANAVRIVPDMESARFETAWSGLRPCSPDWMPLLGWATGFENVYISTGHGRNGVLLAPITGRLVAQEILSGQPAPELAAFRPQRFAKRAA